VLKQLSFGPDAELLGDSQETLTKVTGKINLLYSYLHKYMSEDAADNALEDYARSIVEPGSAEATSLQTSMQKLHNLSVPNLEQSGDGFLKRTLRNDLFYKLFLAVNGKVVDSNTETLGLMIKRDI
jgi:hypothetical protein